MNLRSYRTFQALILAGLGIFLLSKVMDGRVLFYISQRFVILVLLASLALIILAQLVLRERPPLRADESLSQDVEEHDHDHDRQGWVLWLVALPLLVGVLVPERPLGASALESRGMNTTSGLAARGSMALSIELPPAQRTVLDWIRIFGEHEDPQVFTGQAVDVTGFVYHDARLEQDQFMVGRFTIACCVADAMALGMVVDWKEAAKLPDNGWVRVQGVLRAAEVDGKLLPAIEAQQVEGIPQPEHPYLFP